MFIYLIVLLEKIVQKKLISIYHLCSYNFIDQIELNCGCHYCKKCLIHLINIVTDNNVILNVYEKKILKKIKCHCQDGFNYKEAKEKAIDENYCEETKEDAIERLSNSCEEYCLNCLRKMKKSMNVCSNHRNQTYYELEIKVSKVDVWKKKLIEGIDYCEERHIICDYCFEKLSENKDKNNLDHEGTEYKII